jgi:hypothetical protein
MKINNRDLKIFITLRIVLHCSLFYNFDWKKLNKDITRGIGMIFRALNNLK